MRRQAFLFICALTTWLATDTIAAPRHGAIFIDPGKNVPVAVRRLKWFDEQRAYPFERIPPGAYLNARLQADRLLANQAESPIATRLPKWHLIGPRPITSGSSTYSGRVTTIAVDPNSPANVFVGAADGGIWKSTNGGISWKPLTDKQVSLSTGSIAIAPSDSQTIYVGTGEANFAGDNYQGEGILKSTDGGTKWAQICGPFCGSADLNPDGAYIGGIAVDPTNPQNVLVAVSLTFNLSGIWRSQDGGKTWTEAYPLQAFDNATAVLFDPTNAKIAYAAAYGSFGDTMGVLRSVNGGKTWHADNGTGTTSLPTNTGRIALAIAASKPKILYAAIASTDGHLQGVYKTIDSGAHWTQLTATPDFCDYPQCWYDLAISVDPQNPNIVFAGGSEGTSLYRSLDGGATWQYIYPGHGDLHALTFTPDGGTLYIGNDGGVFSTDQITASNPQIQQLNSTLAITQFYPGVSVSPTTASAIGGTQDNGTDLYQNQLAWTLVECGDGGYNAIDGTHPQNVYAACASYIYIAKSTSGGAGGTWHTADAGINGSDSSLFVPPLTIDAKNSSILYYGTNHLYQTTDGASSWNSIFQCPYQYGVIETMASAPSDSDTVYLASFENNGMRLDVSTNATSGVSSTWTDITKTLPDQTITQIAVDPTDSTRAIVVYSGFSFGSPPSGHVYRVENLGSTITDISGNLPNTPVNTVVINPLKTNQIFVGTDVGVFYTNDGSQWTPLMTNFPHAVVLSLALQSSTATLYAATHGRSVWSLDVSALP